jgi:hypothetical protein
MSWRGHETANPYKNHDFSRNASFYQLILFLVLIPDVDTCDILDPQSVISYDSGENPSKGRPAPFWVDNGYFL